jgi:hypothetical protein
MVSVAEERNAERVNHKTGPETLLGPCWVRSRGVNHGQQRTLAVTGRSKKPQVARPTALSPRMEERGAVEFESPH